MKRNKLLPRRRRALRMAALALALLLFCNLVLHSGFLLPIQAVRLAEENAGVCEATRVIAAQWRPNLMHLTDRLYLTEGENSLTLSCTHLQPPPFGWGGAFAWPVDTSDGGDAQAGAVIMNRRDHEETLVFYGRVLGTEDVELTVNVRTEDWDDTENGPHIHVYGHGVGAEDILIRNGCTYFLFVEPNPVPKEARNRLVPHYQLIVNRGGEHISLELETNVASVFWG